MKLRSLLSGLAMLIALFAHPAAARLELTAEEHEMVQWSRGVSPALDRVHRAELATRVDEYLRRSLLLARCPAARDRWRDAERWLDPRYLAIVEEAARVLLRIDDDVRHNLVLQNDLELALIFVYRSWDRPQQLKWLRYMRSPEARRGLDWTNRITVLAGMLEPYATDISNGKWNPIWINWLGELLTKVDLSAAFQQAANLAEPGLGDALAAQFSRPAGKPLTPDERQARDDLIDRLIPKWAAILEAVPKFADPDAVRDGETWFDSVQPLVEVLGNIDKEFIAEAGGGKTRDRRVNEALLAALRAKADEHCAALR